MWFDLMMNMGAYRDWMGTLLCRYNVCCFMQILQILTLASQSSYDDSSWRQTAFSQSVALMSPLCPSVHSEGWLSLVCVGDHSTTRANKPSLPVTYLVCVNGMCYHACQCGRCISPPKSVLSDSCAYKAVLLPERAPCVFSVRMPFIDRLVEMGKFQGAAFEVCVITVCSQTGGRAISTCRQQINLWILPYFKLSEFQNAVVQTFNIYL